MIQLLRHLLLRSSAMAPEDLFALAADALRRPPRILDFGVGFGRLAIPRILAGHDVYGVDVSSEDLRRGRRGLSDAGMDPDRFRLLEDGRSSFPDAYFDVVYSEATLEHVKDLAPFVAEVRRLTAPGGLGLHIYPGRFRPLEGHLMMPFLQWLPRNAVLRLSILAYTMLGIEPADDFPGVAGKGRRERAGVYYSWLLDQTFYRSRADVHNAFSATGFIVSSPRGAFLSALTNEHVVTRLLH